MRINVAIKTTNFYCQHYNPMHISMTSSMVTQTYNNKTYPIYRLSLVIITHFDLRFWLIFTFHGLRKLNFNSGESKSEFTKYSLSTSPNHNIIFLYSEWERKMKPPCLALTFALIWVQISRNAAPARLAAFGVDRLSFAKAGIRIFVCL